MAAAERDPGRSPSCRTTSFSDAATQPVGPVGADSEREGLRSTKMASTKENIYGGTTDGLDASYDVAKRYVPYLTHLAQLATVARALALFSRAIFARSQFLRRNHCATSCLICVPPPSNVISGLISA